MLPVYQNNQKCARSVILTFASGRLLEGARLDFAEDALFFQKITEGTATMDSFVRTFGFHFQISVSKMTFLQNRESISIKSNGHFQLSPKTTHAMTLLSRKCPSKIFRLQV
jgi:hypothetical protein